MAKSKLRKNHHQKVAHKKMTEAHKAHKMKVFAKTLEDLLKSQEMGYNFTPETAATTSLTPLTPSSTGLTSYDITPGL